MTFSKTDKMEQDEKTHVLYNHVSAKLSDLDLHMVTSIPAGGNWQDIPLSIAEQSKFIVS